MRVLTGIIILIMYYKNAYWSAYMPINSNSAFSNKMQSYNVSLVLDSDNHVNVGKYKAYGPMLSQTYSSRVVALCTTRSLSCTSLSSTGDP
jgi:hypothetical protein